MLCVRELKVEERKREEEDVAEAPLLTISLALFRPSSAQALLMEVDAPLWWRQLSFSVMPVGSGMEKKTTSLSALLIYVRILRIFHLKRVRKEYFSKPVSAIYFSSFSSFSGPVYFSKSQLRIGSSLLIAPPFLKSLGCCFGLPYYVQATPR